MANQTINGTNQNYDSPGIAGLLNGETITINSGSLTINADVRHNQQAAVMGNITVSSILGGTVLIDGTQVWELPFTASTGTVPAQGALNTNGVLGGTSAATGELTRVWATGNLNPSAAGGAMPATGFIKLRTTVGTFQAGEVVTLPGGATVTITNAGRRSWLHIVGGEALAIAAARVSGTCSMTGDWYEIGTTNGADDQTFQFPVADYCPAIQIETAVGSGVYEWWLYADNRWGTATQFVATDVRGKYFGMDPATGVITIARRATNPCGFKPVSGLRVRIPNLICSSSSSANWNANTFSTTASNRYRGINVASTIANASYDKVCSNWDIISSNGNNWTITNSASMVLRGINTMSGTVTLDNVAVGCLPVVSYVNSAAVACSSCTNVVITNCRFTKRENDGSGDNALFVQTSINVTLTNVQAEVFGSTGSQTRTATVPAPALTLSRCGTTTYNNCTVIGGAFFPNTHVSPSTMNGLTFADYLVGTNVSTSTSISGIVVGTCTDFTINGPINWFGNLSGVQPRFQFISINTTCKRVVMQSIGTSAAPLDLGNQSAGLILVGDTTNSIIRRCYAQNSRSNFLVSPNVTMIDCDFDNCGTDYADAHQISGTRVRYRGLKTGLGGATAANLGTNVADLFTSATAGRIVFTGNDPNPTNPQLVIAGGVGAGTSGAGAVILPNLNDTATWETPWFILGHTALANSALALTGTNTGNFNYDFQYDLGSGWNGTWLAATGANLSGIGAINPAVGIKLKMRATTTVANTTNAIQFISVITVTTASAQDTLYPFPFDATGVVGNLVAGSRVQIYNQTTSTQVANEVSAGTTYSYSYYSGTGISAGDTIRIRVSKLGKLPQTLLAIATASGFSATANAIDDAIYNSNGIDGSTVTEFIEDYPNIQIDVNDPDGVTTVQRIYAWLRYVETTSNGIQQWFDVVTPTDSVNYLIDSTKLNLKIDNTTASPVFINGGRLYRSDGATIIATISGSVQMDPNRVYNLDAGPEDIWNYPTASATVAGSMGEQVAKKLLTTNKFIALQE